MTNRKIEFYKMRDFGQKLNATIEFIRQNFSKFFLSLLLIAGPASLLMGLIMKGFMTDAFNMGANPDADPLAIFGPNYFFMIVISAFMGVMLSLTCFSYMELYRNKEITEFSVVDVFRNALSRFGAAFILFIIIVITVIVSSIFFILPGIYFFVVLSLALPILFFEKTGPFEAFGRCFRLIKEKWWSTFGLLFVSAIIAYVAAMIFSVPFYALYVFEIFNLSSTEQPDPTAFINMFSSWYMAFSMMIMMIGSYLSYSIVIVALAFQYFNLAERANAYGLIDKIQDFENVK